MNTVDPLPAHIAYVIGIEGGPQATYVRFCKADGALLGEGQSGASELTLGINQAWENIQLAIYRAVSASGVLEQAQVQPHASNCFIGVGVAGVEDQTLRQRFLAANPGHTHLCLHHNTFAQ